MTGAIQLLMWVETGAAWLSALTGLPVDPWVFLFGCLLVVALVVGQVHHWLVWWQDARRIEDDSPGVRIKKSRAMPVDAFFKFRKKSMKSFKGQTTRPVSAFPGVYILHNRTNGKYYVGQGRNVLDRANHHFTGRGNGDVYVDYKNGHDWTVTLVNLDETSFSNLNDLERHLISKYDAFYNGYNKTRGNRT